MAIPLHKVERSRAKVWCYHIALPADAKEKKPPRENGSFSLRALGVQSKSSPDANNSALVGQLKNNWPTREIRCNSPLLRALRRANAP